MLPVGTPLGQLRIDHVLDVYDGPKLFVAKSTLGAKYVALWIESLRDAERWFYVAISDSRPDELLTAQISIRAVYTSAENGWIYEIISPKDKGIASVNLVRSSEIDVEDLPPENDFLDQEEIISGRRRTLRMYADTDRLNSVAVAWRHWGNCQESSAKLRQPKTPRWQPRIQQVMLGSFSVDVGLPEGETHVEAVRGWAAFLREAQNGKKVRAKMIKHHIDKYACESFLEAIRHHDMTVKISVFEDQHSITTFVIDPILAVTLLDRVQSIVPLLASNRIPQADELDRVIRLVLLWDESRGGLSPEDLGVSTQRQVNYYKQAARILGLLEFESGDMLTHAGRGIKAAESGVRLQILRTQFETSECGEAWRNWARKPSLEQVKPDSAATFLAKVAQDLAEYTIARRAKTLASWHQHLYPAQSELNLEG